jgi:enamine deaminase RidA (YjgF/YER057c/UK114 family)
LDIVAAALEQGGFSMEDVVRTRMYVTRAEDVGPVSAVHGEVLGGVRPASTLVRVAGLIEPSLLVEIEVDARRGAG